VYVQAKHDLQQLPVRSLNEDMKPRMNTHSWNGMFCSCFDAEGSIISGQLWR